MANTKISALTANTNPNGNEEFVYAYNNANGKITLNTMKTFVGGAGITELNADANIWELSAGTYATEHDLYYKTGEKTKTSATTNKQLINVIETSGGQIGYFVISVGDSSGLVTTARASFGYSDSSSSGVNYALGAWDRALQEYAPATVQSYDLLPLGEDSLTQVVNDIDGSETIAVGTEPLYAGVTYTILAVSVKSGETYSIGVDGTSITNPLNIALPSSSSKPCVITLIATDSTHAVITGCTIGN